MEYPMNFGTARFLSYLKDAYISLIFVKPATATG